MYINTKNINYGIATATYADYVVVANPDFIPYNPSTASVYHTGSVDYFQYNSGLDEHILINTLQRPISYADILITTETSSVLNTELPLELALDTTNVVDLENLFGQSLDLMDTNLIIGCPNYLQQIMVGNNIIQSSGSAAYVFNIGLVNSTASYNSLLQTIPNSSSVQNSFGASVAINRDWLAVGCPLENNSSGSVFIYQSISGSWSLYQEISASTTQSNALFGHSLKLNKDENTPSGRLVVGCGNPAVGEVFFFEMSGSKWNQTYVFTPTYATYPLTIGNYVPYNMTRNTTSGFGNSVSTYGDSVIIGEYLDRTVYEYSGSDAYQQGSVSIFERCNPSSSLFNLSFKTYGNINTLRSNYLGYSVDIFDSNAVVGIPKSNQQNISASYVEQTLNQYYQCEDNILTSLNGQVALLINESGSWGIENIYQKKKKYLSPYRAFGYSVSVADYSMVVGAPILLSTSTPSINIITTQSQNITLDEICGKSYIYNLNNLQDSFHIGNVFYRNGKIVLMTSGSIFQGLFMDTGNDTTYSYNLNFNGEYTIYEKQIICPVEPGEFNVSTNPTSLIKSRYTFDVNNDGKFDYYDLDILMRYMAYKNNQSRGLPFSTDWSSSIVMSGDEISLLNYYISNSKYSDAYISQQVLEYIPIWDFEDTSIQDYLDINGDNIIDVRDMTIMWKYFSNRLTQKNYSSYITANSNRKTLNIALDYLDGLTGRGSIPVINPEFFNYRDNISQDPTGSYLAPYVSSVGLYDKNLELVAVAKLGTPIKIDGQLPINFCIKLDF